MSLISSKSSNNNLIQLIQTTKRPSSTKTSRPQTQSTLTSNNNNFSSSTILSISPSRKNTKQIGISTIDLSTHKITLTQFTETSSHTKLLHKILLNNPHTIIIPNTLNTPLLDLLSSLNITIYAINRSKFNSSEGSLIVSEFGTFNSFKNLSLYSDKYFALCSLNALFYYLTSNNVILNKKCVEVVYECEGVLLDCKSVYNLHVLSNEDNDSLYNILSVFCKTKMGRRILRYNLIQPLKDLNTLEIRLNCIDEITSKDEFKTIHNQLKQLQDFEKLLSGFIVSNSSTSNGKRENLIELGLNNLILLVKLYEKCLGLSELLGNYENPFCFNFCESVRGEGLLEVVYEIKQSINFDLLVTTSVNEEEEEDNEEFTSLKWSKNMILFSVKSNTNQLLNVARRVYEEVCGDVRQLVQNYNKEYHELFAGGIYMELNTSKYSKYEFILKLRQTTPNLINLLPKIFINKSKRGKFVYFSTLELEKLNQRLKSSVCEILLLSETGCERLCDLVRAELSSLQNICTFIGMLDFIYALGCYKFSGSMVRPEYDDTIAIKNGRHPILNDCVGNDVYAYKGRNFNLITGVNGSGKTTYLKQVGLLQILAQIGSYVPADYACFKLFDSIFTRLCDDSANNSESLSTFTQEMRDIGCILRNSSDKSLVLVDEVGRGSSSFDGVGIAVAVCEKFIELGVFSFFVTHFEAVVSYLEKYSCVCLFNLCVDQEDDELKFKYKLGEGKNEIQEYGITAAKKVGFPVSVIRRAKEVVDVMKSKEICEDGVYDEIKRKVELMEKLRQVVFGVDFDDVDYGVLRGVLSELQSDYCGYENKKEE